MKISFFLINEKYGWICLSSSEMINDHYSYPCDMRRWSELPQIVAVTIRSQSPSLMLTHRFLIEE